MKERREPCDHSTVQILAAFDTTNTTMGEEADMIDRLFGREVAELFGRSK